jgi:hypothetical protein
MGLLEKAEKIQSDEDDQVPIAAPPETVIVPDPEPVQKKDSSAKKTRSRKEKKKKKASKIKKEREVKVIPDGFEPAGRTRGLFRYLVDFTINFGLIAVFVGMLIIFYTDVTYPLIFALILSLGNMVYLPSKFSRSAGNVVSGTQYVNTRGDNPSFLYHVGKSANIPFTFLGLTALMFSISAGTDWTTGMKVFIGISLFLMLIPILDRVMYRMRQDGDIALGFWDRIFGGIWLVTADKTQSDSGIMQRLQSFGEYAEQRGMLTEDDEQSS